MISVEKLWQKGKQVISEPFLPSFALASEQPPWLSISNQFFWIWVIPNFVLIINKNDNEISFQGKTATKNNLLYQSGIMIPASEATTITATNFRPAKQVKYLDGIEQKRWALFKTNIDTHLVSKKFISYCTGEISYFSYLNKNRYALPNFYGPNKIQPEQMPADYYNFWKQFQLLDDSGRSISYQSALRDYVGYGTSEQPNIVNEIPDKGKYYQREFRILGSILTTCPLTGERIQAERILFLIKYFDLPQLIAAGRKDLLNSIL